MIDFNNPKVEEYKQNVNKLTLKSGEELYLIGTAHVSAESVELVESVIEEINPDTICVELDEKRRETMMQKNKYQNLDIFKIIKEKQLFFFIGQFILSSFQKKVSEKTGSKPGEEFKKAIELAEIKDKKLILADRNIGTTLKRAWRLTPFKDKLKFIFSSEGDNDFENLDIEELKKKDALEELMNTFAEGLPATKKVLIDERDTYLVYEIQSNLGSKTVAIVGAGHVPGMLEKFKQKVSEETKNEIDFIPPPSKLGKIIPWVIPVIFLAFIIWGFLFGKKDIAQDVLIYWILINGTLSALGCLIAFGHPLTIITGFIAAPITSLNPTIGAGFVTAIVQTFIAKPLVSDFEQIQNKALRFRDWWSNRITKIFLVFLFSSLGSMAGTFIALPALLKLFK